eukprot:1046533-Rhodomonas_salina.1
MATAPLNHSAVGYVLGHHPSHIMMSTLACPIDNHTLRASSRVAPSNRANHNALLQPLYQLAVDPNYARPDRVVGVDRSTSDRWIRRWRQRVTLFFFVSSLSVPHHETRNSDSFNGIFRRSRSSVHCLFAQGFTGDLTALIRHLDGKPASSTGCRKSEHCQSL